MSVQYVNVTTQDELDQLPAGAVAVVREGLFLVWKPGIEAALRRAEG